MAGHQDSAGRKWRRCWGEPAAVEPEPDVFHALPRQVRGLLGGARRGNFLAAPGTSGKAARAKYLEKGMATVFR